jgi:hypothetical protein
MPWAMKRAHLGILSPVLVQLQELRDGARDAVGKAFQIEPEELPAGVRLHLVFNSQEVACWEPGNAAGSAYGSEVADPSSVASSDQAAAQVGNLNVIASYEGRSIELRSVASPHGKGVSVMCPLLATDRLRKPTEILQRACSEGLLWRVGVRPDGTAALYADLPERPDELALGELTRTLEYALGMYLVKERTRPKRVAAGSSSSRARKKQADSSQ